MTNPLTISTDVNEPVLARRTLLKGAAAVAATGVSMTAALGRP